ncbi:hypothetical protein FA15DRAFT_442014 [Coprinopsis marcescibilis]|uniref:Ubiquitin-like domain-containing protein n=1 Tax=Coprinopsis marcescibilis TaxID=230819 RepID=A0A5C3K8T4_COPMA|nr:hypothetical protein FA15DRAFT_442014 [Coprinopsis marcescibilis]
MFEYSVIHTMINAVKAVHAVHGRRLTDFDFDEAPLQLGFQLSPAMTSSESDIPEQGPVSYFQGASHFVVRDSNFTEVRGSRNVITTTTTTIIHNYNYASTFPPDTSSVSNPAVQDAPSSSVAIQRPDPQSELLESFTALLASSRDNEDTSYHWGRIEAMFEDIDRRLTPYSRTLLKRLRQDVGDLKDVAFFTYQAYRACLGSGMGVLVRGHIKRQITACGATIKWVQQKIIDILGGWVPIWTWFDRYLPAAFAGAFLSEPDDIAAVRKDVLGEMQSLGEIWLERSPNLLHHIKVDQIYVVEPLGDRLAIPTRFIESSEQIHMCLQLKCQNTHGAGYIDNRQYQLNESASDLAVDEKGLQRYIRGTGVQLEVTVFVRSAGIESNRCPRPVCGFVNADSESVNVT